LALDGPDATAAAVVASFANVPISVHAEQVI